MARKVKAQGATPARSKAVVVAPVHRYTFLQWLMVKGYDLESEAEKMYRKLTGAKDRAHPPPPFHTHTHLKCSNYKCPYILECRHSSVRLQ